MKRPKDSGARMKKTPKRNMLRVTHYMVKGVK